MLVHSASRTRLTHPPTYLHYLPAHQPISVDHRDKQQRAARGRVSSDSGDSRTLLFCCCCASGRISGPSVREGLIGQSAGANLAPVPTRTQRDQLAGPRCVCVCGRESRVPCGPQGPCGAPDGGRRIPTAAAAAWRPTRHNSAAAAAPNTTVRHPSATTAIIITTIALPLLCEARVCVCVCLKLASRLVLSLRVAHSNAKPR